MSELERKPRIRFKGFADPWEQRKVDSFATLSKGEGYSKSDLTESGTPIILYGRMYTNYQTTIDSVDTFAELKTGAIISKGGEVIIPASGETAEDISRASKVDKCGIILGGDLNIINADKTVSDGTFLAIVLSNGDAQKKVSSLAQGKTVVHIHPEDISTLEISLPDLKEQAKIASLFSSLDSLVTLHQRKLEKLKNIKKSLLERMFA